jgi:hypothetical protein
MPRPEPSGGGNKTARFPDINWRCSDCMAARGIGARTRPRLSSCHRDHRGARRAADVGLS